MQVFFVGNGFFAVKTAPAGAAGLVTAGRPAGAGLSPGTCAKPATAIKAVRQTKMLAFIMSLP